MIQSTYYGDFFDGDFTLLSKTLANLFPEPSKGNVHETSDEYRIQIAVPGFTKEQVLVESNGNTLVITGELPEKEEADKISIKVHQQEFLVAPFKRKYVIPAGFDVNNASAALDNGILTVTIAKSETTMSKRFLVK